MFAWAGVFHVGASSGHWRVTNWALHTAMRVAVKAYAAVEVEPPESLPRQDVSVAASHFAPGCAVCHGAPGEQRSPALVAALPPPPDLAGKVGEWSDAELFWIVKHGIRYTGMPAWPAQTRDDEVWAMVAFLRELPGMSVERYRELAFGRSGRQVGIPSPEIDTLADCSRCHKSSASSDLVPIIAGQNEAYLRHALEAYAGGHRSSGLMQLPAASVDRDIRSAAAIRLASSPSALTMIPADGSDGSPGARLVYHGDSSRGIPACVGCHGTGRDTVYPKIVGQKVPYLANQLRLFRSGTRGGGARVHLMQKAAAHLTDQDIENVSAFLKGLGEKTRASVQ
ncbi:c-type cytochrome [Afipia sp. TerB]